LLLKYCKFLLHYHQFFSVDSATSDGDVTYCGSDIKQGQMLEAWPVSKLLSLRPRPMLQGWGRYFGLDGSLASRP